MDGLLARLAKKWTGAETFNERWQLAHPDNRLSREEREQALLLAFGRELCAELAREADVEAERTTDHESQCTAKIIAQRIRQTGKGE